MSYLLELTQERRDKLIDNCLDKNGKKIDIETILKSNIFSKSEYDDLKLFYNNAQAIKKIEDKESLIEESIIEVRKIIKETSEKIKKYEQKMWNITYNYNEEENLKEEKIYEELLKKLSNYEQKELKLKRVGKKIISQQDSEFDKLLKLKQKED